jgi:hypothetical protein
MLLLSVLLASVAIGSPIETRIDSLETVDLGDHAARLKSADGVAKRGDITLTDNVGKGIEMVLLTPAEPKTISSKPSKLLNGKKANFLQIKVTDEDEFAPRFISKEVQTSEFVGASEPLSWWPGQETARGKATEIVIAIKKHVAEDLANNTLSWLPDSIRSKIQPWLEDRIADLTDI